MVYNAETDEMETSAPLRPGGRPAAGRDPQKREQILDGAKRCFLDLGFEAASMNDITAEAGVSKGTIYVYFENKEDLFTDLIQRERAALMTVAKNDLEEGSSVREALQRFGVTITTKLTSDEVIRCQRIVLGVAERMPQIAETFFGPDPFSGLSVLQDYLDAKVKAGELAIEDTELASRQFLDLSQSSIFKRRLFGNMKAPAPRDEVERVVAIAVDMFLNYYGIKAA
ncbi:MAG TPA: TetR/AcrR family transcriptional regulator [Devosiaceae bacterium]|jgi:AcrR family transcriptional regulator